MVYATIQDAWGVSEMTQKVSNDYVVQNPTKHSPDFIDFNKKFKTQKTNRVVESMDDESYDSNSKYYRKEPHEIYIPKQYKSKENWCESNYKKRYFDEEDNSEEVVVPKLKSKVIDLNEKKEDKIEHFQAHINGCESIMQHIANCPLCKKHTDELNQSQFIKEFLIFASSGIFMLLLLEIIVKLGAKK